MSGVTICLEINANSHISENKESFAKRYGDFYKPIFSFAYSHPKLPITFSFSGPDFDFMADYNSEAIRVLRELTTRHQVEILGGGYYSPIFPLLFPADRSAQIEKFTASIRTSIGKRPTGITLFGSVWDPSLVTTLHSCGIQYVHLDSTLIPTARKSFYPIIVSEQGKSVKVLPVCQDLVPQAEESFTLWSQRIQKAVKKESSAGDDSVSNTPIVIVSFTPEEFEAFRKTQCFTEMLSYIESEMNENAPFNFSLPKEYFKTSRRFTQAYISAGMEWNIAQWSKKPFVKSENKTHFPLTIYDFLNTYAPNRHLYERMMHISMLISQMHGGDKIRKLAASEKLWEAQTGTNYVNLPLGLPAIAKKRQNAYKALNEAERLLRECKEFKENLTTFDYNCDGLNEYVCQMEHFNAVISLRGAQVTEFDVLKSGVNYAANLSRMSNFDGGNDSYQRGLFVEHLLDEEEVKSYFMGNPSGNGIFSRVLFSEKKFDARRKEISMEGKGEFSSLALPVSLRKNFMVSSNGLSVQYILKNEGPFPLKGTFVTELNLPQINFEKNKSDPGLYATNLIENSERHDIAGKKLYLTKNGVSFVQLTDLPGKTNFVLEPNEDAGFIQQVIEFQRPVTEEKTETTSKTLTAALFWNVELDAGREMEKTVNLTITTYKNKNSGK